MGEHCPLRMRYWNIVGSTAGYPEWVSGTVESLARSSDPGPPGSRGGNGWEDIALSVCDIGRSTVGYVEWVSGTVESRPLLRSSAVWELWGSPRRGSCPFVFGVGGSTVAYAEWASETVESLARRTGPARVGDEEVTEGMMMPPPCCGIGGSTAGYVEWASRTGDSFASRFGSVLSGSCGGGHGGEDVAHSVCGI